MRVSSPHRFSVSRLTHALLLVNIPPHLGVAVWDCHPHGFDRVTRYLVGLHIRLIARYLGRSSDSCFSISCCVSRLDVARLMTHARCILPSVIIDDIFIPLGSDTVSQSPTLEVDYLHGIDRLKSIHSSTAAYLHSFRRSFVFGISSIPSC